MLNNIGLKIRMMVAGSMLFTVYALVSGLVLLRFGAGTTTLSLIVIGSILFVGFQYKIGKWLAVKSVGAREMPENSNSYKRIHNKVEQLSEDMDIEKPKLMVAEMGMANAFAVGRKGAGVVVLSEEIIQLLREDELDGVIAHEMAHIKNRDVVIMVIGQSIASIVGIAVQYAVIFSQENSIASYLIGAVAGSIAQFLVMLIVLAISRYREYVADETAAEYTNKPNAMANALRKISGSSGGSTVKNADAASSLFIAGVDGESFENLISTHPPIEDRIERLES